MTWTTGDYAQDRETVCSLADVDSDALREAALKRLAWEKAWAAEQDAARKAQLAEKARSLDAALAGLVERAEAGDLEPEALDAGLTVLVQKEARAAQDAAAPLLPPRMLNLRRVDRDSRRNAQKRAAYAARKASDLRPASVVPSAQRLQDAHPQASQREVAVPGT
jgi:hypothetical protein